MQAPARRKAFTLIELLVVIAIIALLIGILLPALGRARDAGRLAVSLNNVRSIMTATVTYQSDTNGKLPTHMVQRGAARAWNTWTYGGNYNDKWWKSQYSSLHDVYPYNRPLNYYLYPDNVWPKPLSPIAPPTDAQREAWSTSMDLPSFKSPGDKISYQRSAAFNDGGGLFKETALDHGSYSDVGTSYHFNMKWYFFFREERGLSFDRAYNEGLRRLNNADALIQPSTFGLYADETADLIVNKDGFGYPSETIDGEFGGINKTVMGFLDGHVGYIKVEPNQYRTKDYNFLITLGDEHEDIPDP